MTHVRVTDSRVLISKMNNKLNPGDHCIEEMYDEDKEHYVDHLNVTPFHSSFGLAQLVIIPQGFTTTSRIGKRVTIDAIHVTGVVRKLPDMQTCRAYYAIIYDKFPTGIMPAASDIFTLNGNYGADLRNMDFNQRFKIIFKRNFNFIAELGVTLCENSQFYINDYLYVDLPMVFKELGTGNIDDIELGAIYLLTMGDFLSSAGDQGLFYRAIRTFYTDII